MDFDMNDFQAEDALLGSEFEEAYNESFIPQQSILTAYVDDSSILSDSLVYTMSTASTETSYNKFKPHDEHEFNNYKFGCDLISNDDISCAFDLSFDFNASDHESLIQRETFFKGGAEIVYDFEHVSLSKEIHETRKSESNGNELPMMCVTPLQIMNSTTTISGSSLLELSNAGATEKQMDKKSAIEDSTPSKRALNKQRRASLHRRMNDKSSPYPSPPVSDEDDSYSSPTKSRRNGHLAGFNRQTGELTLVGTYPPDFHDNTYYCPDPICREVNGKDYFWTTKNGYKYHLEHNCLRNPSSRKSLSLKSGNVEMKPSKAGFLKECECGATFKSEIGFRMHKTQNESTRDGKCLLKARRRCHTNTLLQDNQYQQDQSFDVQYWLQDI